MEKENPQPELMPEEIPAAEDPVTAEQAAESQAKPEAFAAEVSDAASETEASDTPENAESSADSASGCDEKPAAKGKFPLLMTIAAYVLAFCIPTAIGLLMYKVKEIAPFGDKSVLCMDLWGQYAPMYAQLAQGETLADLFYSWNGAFGYNNWAQSAYYCNSIFLLPLRLVPLDKLVFYINWICLLKLGFAGASCLAFLRYKTKSKSLFLIGASSAYALCAYMLAFLSQPMWTDSLIYAPLILIGMERMLHEKKPLMYILTLALTICSSFYIGFAVCIFCCLYFAAQALPVLSIGKNAEGRYHLRGLKDLGLMTGRFSVSSLLAGALSAPVILPIAQAVSLTIASEAEFPEKLKWYGNLSYIIRNMLSEQPLYVEYTGANLSVGMIAFFLLPLYFLNKRIPAMQRAVNGAVLAFLGLSLNCNFLDFMWHGFHFPNQLPGRWTFLFSLFVVLLICTAFVQIKELSLPRTIGGLAIGSFAVYIAMRGIGGQAEAQVRKIYLVLMAVSAAVILLTVILEMLRRHSANNPESRLARVPFQAISMFCAAALTVLCIADSGMSYVKVSQFEEGGTRTSDGVSFTENTIKQSTYGTKWVCGDDTFYRTEANGGYTFNPSMIGNYHGMGYYSSTMRGETFKFLRFMGNRVYADKVSSVYNNVSPVQNSLFGVRYFIDYARGLNTLPGAEIIEKDDVCDIVENTTALSLAYPVSEEVLSLEVGDEIRGIQNQNTLVNALVGEEVNVFQKMNTTAFTYENATLSESANWNQNYFHTIDGSMPVKFNYTYHCETDGAFYVEHNFRAGTLTATWGDQTRSIDTGSQKFYYLGRLAAGTEVQITAELSGIQLGCVGMNMYQFDEAKWNSVYEKLSASQMQVEEFKNTKIWGTINLPQSQLVMTTIPQDGGWKVYCDGKQVETKLAPGGLICMIVPEGTHTLEFKYHVPTLGLGITISITALLLSLLLCIPQLRRLVAEKLSVLKKVKTASTAPDSQSENDEN